MTTTTITVTRRYRLIPAKRWAATRGYVETHMKGNAEISAETRLRLFHAIRDLTTDAYGGWHLVTNRQSGGGLFARRIGTRRHYDMEHGKAIARHSAGLDD